MLKRLFILLALPVSLFNISHAIQVSGDVYGIWNSANNPYEVTGDLRIPKDSTLIIEPGCYIEFQGWYYLMVDTMASLQALGIEGDSIAFTANDTTIGWAGIRLFSADSSSSFSYCIIEWGKGTYGSMPDENGAGIFIKDSFLSIVNSSFRKNNAWDGEGGGIFSWFLNLIISNSKFSLNKAGLEGSAICSWFSDITINENEICNNSIFYPTGGEWGGAISCLRCDGIISKNNIFSNYSYSYAGGIIFDESTILVTENRIIDNQALLVGGGLVSHQSALILNNNIICNNTAGWFAGGIYIFFTISLKGSNNTITGNSAGNGGGLRVTFAENDSLINTIILGNTSLDSLNINLIESDSSHIFYSDIEGGWPGEGNIDSDPMFVDPDGGDFQLSWDNFPIDDETKSPCIDAGAPWSPLDPDSTRADIGAWSFDQHVGIDDYPDRLPRQVRLEQNYPNPFNASTVISYALPFSSLVRLEIYDILGRKVTTLIDKQQQTGYHQAIRQADDFSSGMYFYKLQTGDYNETKKMLLLK